MKLRDFKPITEREYEQRLQLLVNVIEKQQEFMSAQTTINKYLLERLNSIEARWN